jgi:carotenoid 1,2-hydratase
VFSPYYAWSGRSRPQNHCAINLALYRNRPRRWTMTERGELQVTRSPERIRIGPSSAAWEDGELVIRVDDVAAPVPLPVRGTIRVRPRMAPQTEVRLSEAGEHIWQPVSPVCDVTADIKAPRLAWRGTGYLDSNRGNEPLEAGFQGWTWARTHEDARCTVLYDARSRAGGQTRFALDFLPDGQPQFRDPPPAQALPGTIWAIGRHTGCEPEGMPAVLATFEDTPFYARSLVRTHLDGKPVDAFHESLNLDRFAAPWVRMLLPVRMPRFA